MKYVAAGTQSPCADVMLLGCHAIIDHVMMDCPNRPPGNTHLQPHSLVIMQAELVKATRDTLG